MIDENKLNNFLDEMMEINDLPGLAIGVYLGSGFAAAVKGSTGFPESLGDDEVVHGAGATADVGAVSDVGASHGAGATADVGVVSDVGAAHGADATADVGVVSDVGAAHGAGEPFEYIGVRGYRDFGRRTPLERDDIFHCASVSKLFTASAVMKLVEAGAFGLYDRVCDLLPNLEIQDDRFREVRLWNLLTHTSGLGDVDDYHWDYFETDEGALSRYVYGLDNEGNSGMCDSGGGVAGQVRCGDAASDVYNGNAGRQSEAGKFGRAEVLEQPMLWYPKCSPEFYGVPETDENGELLLDEHGEPKKLFRYSNIAFEILGQLVAEYSDRMPGCASGRESGSVNGDKSYIMAEHETDDTGGIDFAGRGKLSYEDFVARYLMSPAGMTASTMKTFERCDFNSAEARNECCMAAPHTKDDRRRIVPVDFYPYQRYHAPSSTLTTNVSDLLKWGRAHLAASAGKSMPIGKMTPTGNEPPTGRKTSPNEKSSIAKMVPLDEKSPVSKVTLFSKEAPIDKMALLSKEAPIDKNASLDEKPSIDEVTSLTNEPPEQPDGSDSGSFSDSSSFNDNSKSSNCSYAGFNNGSASSNGTSFNNASAYSNGTSFNNSSNFSGGVSFNNNSNFSDSTLNSYGAVLQPETYDSIWRNYATVPNNGEKIGLGWFMRQQTVQSHQYTLMGHEGTDDGFRASFWICPELDAVTIVLSNLSGAPVKKINKKLFDLIAHV